MLSLAHEQKLPMNLQSNNIIKLRYILSLILGRIVSNNSI